MSESRAWQAPGAALPEAHRRPGNVARARPESADIDFAHPIKNYAGTSTKGPDGYRPSARVVAATPTPVAGRPKIARRSTSHIERVRMQRRRFTHLTTGFSKTLDNVRAMVEVCVVWYNCCRAHHTLRIAMEAGWTDHIRTVREPWLT